MTQLLLHIGANKTGSSAVQSFIRDNLSLLDEAGYAVPDNELKWSKRVTGFQVFGLAELFADGGSPERTAAVFDELMRTAPAGKTVLISAENLSNQGIQRFLTQVCSRYRTKVILYIRRQDELLTSSWQQWNSKIESDLDAWIVKSLRLHGNWAQIVEAWEQIAGKGAVTVRIYERAELRDGNVILDFMDCLGLGDKAGAAKLTGDEVNPSYSDVITPLVSGNRGIFRDVHDNEFYQLVGKLTGDSFAKRKRVSLISRDMREAIMEHYRAQNERVCRAYFPGRARLFAAVDHSKYEYLSHDQMREQQMKFLTEMVFRLSQKTFAK